MNVGIVGSRSFDNYEFLTIVLDGIFGRLQDQPVKIISGGAVGADSLAKQYAQDRGIDIQEFLPDWDQHGRAAGPIRNKTIVENSEMILAFWDGQSKGTASTVRLAKKAGVPVHIYW